MPPTILWNHSTTSSTARLSYDNFIPNTKTPLHPPLQNLKHYTLLTIKTYYTHEDMRPWEGGNVTTCPTTRSIPNYRPESNRNDRRLEGANHFLSYSDATRNRHTLDSLARFRNINYSCMTQTPFHDRPSSYIPRTFWSYSVLGGRAPDYFPSAHGPPPLVYKAPVP